MSKSFSQAPKPQSQLPAEVISAFERDGVGQDTQGRTPANVESGETGAVGMSKSTKAESRIPTEVETGVATDKTERMRRLSVDLPESWHRRFKVACARADKKMINEVAEFIKRRTLELENE